MARAGSLASRHAVRRAALRVMGPDAITHDALVERLLAEGLDLGPEPDDRVHDALHGDAGFFELDDDRWIHLPTALDGLAWATVVPDELPAPDCLPTHPDLALVEWCALDAPMPLQGASDTVHAAELDDGTDVLVGPPGWLDTRLGTTVAVRVVGGALALDPLDAVPEPHPAHVAALADAFGRTAHTDVLRSEFLPGDEVEITLGDLHEVLAEALAAAGDAFRGGVAPVDALLREAGLERRQHQVAPAGADWRAVDRLFRRRRLAAAHRLDEHEVDEAEMLIGASLVVLHGDDAPLGPPGEEADAAFLCALCLLRPGVARAFVGAHAERGTPPEDLAAFARFLLERVDPPADTGVRWLLARALDHLGDAPGAEAELEQAARSDIDHPLVLQMLAGFRSDRGDAPGALALLDRAAVALRPHEQRNQDDAGDAGDDGDDQDGERALADEALRAEVTGYARQRPTAVARRNDPCPCGSGRKYKACHLGKERHALVDRAPWLYDKACRYLRDGRHRTVALEVARAIHDAADGDHRLLLALLESPVTFDVSLHEGGVFADFLAERDALLPDDEALLAAQWALVARSVFEVEAKGHDSLALRDLRTGDRIEVTNITPSDHTRIGTYLLGRPLPVGDTWRALSGFVPVPLAVRDWALGLLDEHGEDPFAVAELVGRCLAPPRLQNADGQELVFHQITWHLPDPGNAVAALRADPRLVHDGEQSFTLVRDSQNQRDTVVLTLHVEGNELCAFVNSDERAAEVNELVASLVPDAHLVDDDVVPVEEELADHRALGRAGDDASGTLDPNDPANAELYEQLAREMERRFLDEHIPALGGRTPREACDDPIGRAELERLLATFDEAPRFPGAMDPDRIRALLGLPSR